MAEHKSETSHRSSTEDPQATTDQPRLPPQSKKIFPRVREQLAKVATDSNENLATNEVPAISRDPGEPLSIGGRAAPKALPEDEELIDAINVDAGREAAEEEQIIEGHKDLS